MKKKKYYIGKTLIFIGLLIIFLGCYQIVNKIFIPAYYSTLGDCTTTGNTVAQQAGYYTAGKIVIQPVITNTKEQTYSPESNYSIQITNENENPPQINAMILKHENCHLQQLQSNRVKACDNNNGKFYRFTLEIECYIKQYM
jgi:hypothetical protein